MAILPLVMTSQGLQPAAPADLRNRLISLIAASNPDYTANLPGSLIEDISSTDVYALVESDSFLVDLVNSVTPFGANAYLLNQLGILYGVDRQPITNTSVYVIFTGTPGYVIGQGFVVSDGTYQYITQTGGIIGVDGNSLPMYALASQPGAWPVAANTVVQMATSVPANVALAVNNPVAGIPSQSGEPITIYRERCFTAGLAASTGMARYLKTLVGNVPGVQSRLISVQQQEDTEDFTIIVGGGDPYQVAYAIWTADFYTPGLSGALIRVAGVSNTNPAIITTADNHNLATGNVEMIHGMVGMELLNDRPYPITVTGLQTFTMPVDATTWGLWQSGGIVTPNPINEYVSISDFPDSFIIPFVTPPQEVVNMVVTWITNSPNYVSPSAIAQAATPAIVEYINSLPAGPTPINLNVLNQVFIDSIANILAGELLIDLEWTISISGVGALPAPGTQIIYGDRYSYFYTDNSQISVVQGVF
jgi:Ubiquitin-activating enzyme E1 FCCH domain/Baseplate J-like protein